MSQNLSGNGYVLTHCLEPKGPAFSGETQCKELELGCPLEKSDHHLCRMTHPAEITLGFVRPTYISVVRIHHSQLSRQILKEMGAYINMNQPGRICQNMDTVNQTTPGLVR